MSKSNVTSVKTPGQAAPLPAPSETEGGAAESTGGVELPAQIPTDHAALAQLVEAQVAKALRARDRAKLTEAGKEAADLPDQSEIDPNKIDRAVLTKQGYVVPPKMGERPEHLKNLT